MVHVIDPVFYTLQVNKSSKIPMGVSVDRTYTVIGYITDSNENKQFISHWIVIGDNGSPAYLWPASVTLTPNLPN